MAELTVPVDGKSYTVDLYRTHRQTKINVEGGARVATATETFNVGRKARNDLESDLRVAVVAAWATQFGKLDWDRSMVQVFVVHTVNSVTVEMCVTGEQL